MAFGLGILSVLFRLRHLWDKGLKSRVFGVVGCRGLGRDLTKCCGLRSLGNVGCNVED